MMNRRHARTLLLILTATLLVLIPAVVSATGGVEPSTAADFQAVADMRAVAADDPELEGPGHRFLGVVQVAPTNVKRAMYFDWRPGSDAFLVESVIMIHETFADGSRATRRWDPIAGTFTPLVTVPAHCLVFFGHVTPFCR